MTTDNQDLPPGTMFERMEISFSEPINHPRNYIEIAAAVTTFGMKMAREQGMIPDVMVAAMKALSDFHVEIHMKHLPNDEARRAFHSVCVAMHDVVKSYHTEFKKAHGKQSST